MVKPEPPCCNRCTAKNAPLGYSYPYITTNTLVSLCNTCYNKLKEQAPSKSEQQVLLSKYIK